MTSFRKEMQEARTAARKECSRRSPVAIGNGWELRYNTDSPTPADEGSGALPSNNAIRGALDFWVPEEFRKPGQVWIEGRFVGADSIFAYTFRDEFHEGNIEWWSVDIPEEWL